ncbi:MAG: hypothetical protein ACHQ0J_00795 [Candidatus Dormibacterales bacterium]
MLLVAIAVTALAGCYPSCSGGSSPAASTSPTATPTPEARLTPSSLVADASCDAEATSRSLNSNTATSFTLVNRSSVAISLFWINFQGQRVHYQDVPAGQTRGQATFITHPWVAADPSGKCTRLFLVTTPATITIG